MGVHTGDSVTVAPAQTLTDREYQDARRGDPSDAARSASRPAARTCSSRHPETGRMVVIEMNPRVSRSSALASKATGFPIAKIAAKLAVGYTLDELPNDITRETPACFRADARLLVVKIPRFAFEKFPGAEAHARRQHEIGRRDDGHRPQLQGGLPEGAARAGNR
jgi:carbamoyl-phosphate synthase large subunit